MICSFQSPKKKPPTKAEVKQNGDAPTTTPKGEVDATVTETGDGPKAAKAAKAPTVKEEKEDKSPAKNKKAVKKSIPGWATLTKAQLESLEKDKSGKKKSTVQVEAVPAKMIVRDAVENSRDSRGELMHTKSLSF